MDFFAYDMHLNIVLFGPHKRATLWYHHSFQRHKGMGSIITLFFFILYVEGLSSLLYKAEQGGRILELPIVRGGIRLNNLFFLDDNLLFCKANIMEWVSIQEILKVYEHV